MFSLLGESGRLCDGIIAPSPKPRPVPADQKAGVRIDVPQPINGILVRRNLIRGERRGREMGWRLALPVVVGRCLVAAPSRIVKGHAADHRLERGWLREVIVAPVRCHDAADTSVIGLVDQNKRAVRKFTNNHENLLKRQPAG